MSEDNLTEDIETFCPKTQIQITLTLQLSQAPHGNMVTGKPIFCSGEASVSRCYDNLKCYLRTERLTTRRK
jgi:hypothetical protein